MGDNYKLDVSGNEYYTSNSPHSVIFIKKNGNEIYAKDKFSREYYPTTGQVAKTKDGKPTYARGPNNHVIFMKNQFGDEMYLKDDDLNDFIVPNLRYAKKVDHSTFYPILKNKKGEYYETLLKNRYAKDSDGKYFYPLDDLGNERWHDGPTETPEEYPITNDNYYLIPQKNGEPYFLDHLKPKLTKENIKYILVNTDGSINYVTSVQSVSRKSRGLRIPYKTKPFEIFNPNSSNNKDNSNKGMDNPDKNLENGPSDDSNGDDNNKNPDKNDDNDTSNDSDDENVDNTVIYSEEDDTEDEEEDRMDIGEDNNDEKSPDTNTLPPVNNGEESTTTTNNDKDKSPKTNKQPPVILKVDGTGLFSNNGSLNFYFILTALFTIVLGAFMWYFKIRHMF